MYKLKYLFDDYDSFTSDCSWGDYDEAEAYRKLAYTRFKPDVNVVILIEDTEADDIEYEELILGLNPLEIDESNR